MELWEFCDWKTRARHRLNRSETVDQIRNLPQYAVFTVQVAYALLILLATIVTRVVEHRHELYAEVTNSDEAGDEL